jgi:hypothetical protein
MAARPATSINRETIAELLTRAQPCSAQVNNSK